MPAKTLNSKLKGQNSKVKVKTQKLDKKSVKKAKAEINISISKPAKKTSLIADVFDTKGIIHVCVRCMAERFCR